VHTGLLATDGRIWRRLAYAGARFGPRWWLRFSPPVFGLAFGAVLPRVRAQVRRNLRRVRGERGLLLDQLDVMKTFADYARCLAESLAMERPEAVLARRRIRGEQHLERAAASGRGIMLVTAHAGPWDAAAWLLAGDQRADVMVVMLPEHDERARQLHDRVRERSGLRVAHVGVHPLDALPLLRHLKNGGIAAAQLDRVPGTTRAIEVSLFGAPFRVPEGPFRLAAMAGAPVLPLFVRRVGHFDYDFWVAPPIELGRRPSALELRTAAQSAATEMERFIRAHPTQWFHFEGEG
jgi:lauroyl/myristoyl acyltransferase